MTRPHVMDSEHMVVDQAFDEVEEAPAGEHRAPERPASPGLTGKTRDAKQQTDAGSGQEPGRQVKEPILRHLRFQCSHRLDLTRFRGAHQMVPAEDLVQHDAVKETAEPKPEQ